MKKLWLCSRINTVQMTNTVKATIDRFAVGYVFTADDFRIEVAAAFERIVEQIIGYTL
jgi:hypothetical protein